MWRLFMNTNEIQLHRYVFDRIFPEMECVVVHVCAICARRCAMMEYDLKCTSHFEGAVSINGMGVFGSVETVQDKMFVLFHL